MDEPYGPHHAMGEHPIYMYFTCKNRSTKLTSVVHRCRIFLLRCITRSLLHTIAANPRLMKTLKTTLSEAEPERRREVTLCCLSRATPCHAHTGTEGGGGNILGGQVCGAFCGGREISFGRGEKLQRGASPLALPPPEAACLAVYLI